jgi:hypothetical protein
VCGINDPGHTCYEYLVLLVKSGMTPCLHLIYEMWDSMIEQVKKEIYQWERKEPDEV